MPGVQLVTLRVEAVQRDIKGAMAGRLADDFASLRGLRGAFQTKWEILAEEVRADLQSAINTLKSDLEAAATQGLSKLKEVLAATASSTQGELRQSAQDLLARLNALNNGGTLTPATIAGVIDDALKVLGSKLNDDLTAFVAAISEEWDHLQQLGHTAVDNFIEGRKAKFLAAWKSTIDFVFKDFANVGAFFPEPLNELWREGVTLVRGAISEDALAIDLSKLSAIPSALGSSIVKKAAEIFANPLDQLFGDLKSSIGNILPGLPGQLLTSFVSSGLTQLIAPLAGNPIVGLALLILRGFRLFGLSEAQKRAIEGLDIPLPIPQPEPNIVVWQIKLGQDPFSFEMAKILVGVEPSLTMSEFLAGLETGSSKAQAIARAFAFLGLDSNAPAPLSSALARLIEFRVFLEKTASALIKELGIKNATAVALTREFVAAAVRGQSLETWERRTALKAVLGG